ncbi:Gar1/Naf1 RNA binding region-domain-containing protein [Boletus edulis BED1]|uniref:H/ACA ribonucleoprotein complex non-core subunit NAF1 n=1 Tax=Boletus edulis BED1 TaxID=1328754 RepID=A0AAD4C1Q1_BOLED|nr:Gar1/Naf1 RNA binding region-domain-containing protein [Boletus edulis BED1]
MDFDFKVPSTVAQDLLLIQDLIGSHPSSTVADKHAPDPLDSSDDSIASTDSEVESEDEVEAGLTSRDDDSGVSTVTSDSASPSDSEVDASSSSDSEEGDEYAAPQRQRLPDNIEDEESGVAAAVTYLQTKNEIVDANVMIPAISEVEPCDTLEKVGEVMSIVGNLVIVRGLPMDHINSFEHTLDAESLLVFEDRKVLGYIYETFGPTSQPLYQVKFNERYPLDTDKVRLSREVFHVPQRSHFVFVDRLKNLRGSDASNIHDEEPADDEIEFSDDEKEAAFRAQRKKRRGRSMSSSRQSTPAPSRIHIDDMAQDTYHGSNPYDAHGPYDDDYPGLPRPPPVPYDDPYADVPTSDARDRHIGVNEGGEPNRQSGDGPKASHGRTFSRGSRARGAQNHQSWSTTRRGNRHKTTTARQTFDSGPFQSHPAASQMVECARGYGQIGDAIAPHPHVQPHLNPWLSPTVNNIQGYQQPFIQPHINPRFAAMFGLNLPSESMTPWASQNAHDPTILPHHQVDTWTMHSSTSGREGEGDTYSPM